MNPFAWMILAGIFIGVTAALVTGCASEFHSEFQGGLVIASSEDRSASGIQVRSVHYWNAGTGTLREFEPKQGSTKRTLEFDPSRDKTVIRPDGVNGDDDRREPRAGDATALRENCKATCVIVRKSDLTTQADGTAMLKLQTMQERGFPLCSGEKFADQPTAGGCGTAFLVRENIVASADHCLSDANFRDRAFVFDFMNVPSAASHTVSEKAVAYPKRIVARSGNQDSRRDWVLVELDRSMIERTPVALAGAGQMFLGTKVYMIGHPRGMPMKVAENGKIIAEEAGVRLTTTLDTFFVNSGSPVFDLQSHRLVGIFVAGQWDLRKAPGEDCYRTYTRTDSDEAREYVCHCDLWRAELK